jgi:hypothetical protein
MPNDWLRLIYSQDLSQRLWKTYWLDNITPHMDDCEYNNTMRYLAKSDNNAYKLWKLSEEPVDHEFELLNKLHLDA